MKNIRMIGATLIGAAILVVAPVSLHQSPDKSVLVSLNSAEAVIGRPLTPGSVAGGRSDAAATFRILSLWPPILSTQDRA
jgi:hypothetical protein